MLLKKAFDSMSPGGTIFIQEHLLGPDRTKPLHGSLFSINMLVNTSGGRSYSAQEMKKWLASAGFRKVGSKVKNDVSLIYGKK
jgi:hypothetical protein